MHGNRTLATRGLVALLVLVGAAAVGGSSARADGPCAQVADTCYPTIQQAIDAASPNDTIDISGTFDESGIDVDKAGLKLVGGSGAKIELDSNSAAQINLINIQADDVTISGLELQGPVTSSYLDFAWGSNISRGIFVPVGVDGFSIADDDIHDVRNGILIDGRNTGSVTGNTIENTKGAISIQYTDFTSGGDITVSGNRQGSNGNEWGVNLHLNGDKVGTQVSTLPPYLGHVAAPDAVQQAMLANSAANDGWTVQDQDYASSNRTETVVGGANASDSHQGSPLSPLATVQAGVDGVVSGGVVDVRSGAYAESVTVDKPLTLNGAQAGVDARGRSASESKVGSIAISAKDVVVDGFSFTSTSTPQVSVSSPTTLSGLVVRNDVFGGYKDTGLTAYDAGDILVEHNQLNAPTGLGEGIQLRASAVQGGCSGAQVRDNTFAAATSNGGSDVNLSCTGSNSSSVTVSGNTTSGDTGGSSFAGFSGVVDGISVTDNSGSTDGSPIFFFGSVSGTALVDGNTFTGSSGSGVSIHGGEYTSDTPSTGTFTITNNHLSGNVHGISVASVGLGTGGRVVAHGNDLSAGVVNASSTTIDATGNWWGAVAGPGTVTGATTTPWCTDSACTSSSDNADLSSLSLAGATLSPAFASSTTSYAASVGNATTSAVVSETAGPGATVAVSGGSSLAVGANTVKVTVTSADGSRTKVYTVTVTRAATSSGGTTGGGTTTGTTTPAPQPTQAATVVNQPQSVQASPAKAGTVAVVVAPATTPAGATTPAAPVSVALSWTPGAFTMPVTVQVTPQPQEALTPGATPGAPPAPKPVAGGFAVGGTVVQVNVTTDAGQAVTQFAAPLVLHVSAMGPGQVPAFSHDGTSWTTIPRLSSPELPAGQADGYFVDADGSVDIYTRHATLFGLLVDTRAPTRPVLHARLTGQKLRLTIHAHDNLRVASYQVRVNGKLVERTKHAYVVLKARAGRFQVVALDAAGNRSKASKQVVLVRSRSKSHPFRLT